MAPFWLGILVSLLPSILAVAWLLWQSDALKQDPQRDTDLAI